MRIRKHAKVSPLVYAASSLEPNTLTKPNNCELNQSPWDVLNFSSNLYQVDGDDNSFLGNGSFDDSIGTLESVAEEMRDDINAGKWVYSDGVAAAEEGGGGGGGGDDVEMEEEVQVTPLGYKNKKKAKNEVRKSDNKALEGSSRRTRMKKASSSSNPNDYYYYSGFGPRWGGKRRGGGGGGGGSGGGGSELELSNNIINTDHLEPIYEPEQIDSEEFDYGEEEEEENGKKRARKPIKARSLKSLM